MTKKKITRVETPNSTNKEVETFKPTEENKKKATTNRLIALVSWALAIAAEVFAILQLRKSPIPMTLIIILIVVAAAFAITGSVLWKKANRLDPASEANKVKFFIQNQLGLIISIIAFLPLIILVLRNEELEGKQKGLITVVAVVALAVSSYFGFDFNPVSVEQYTQETARVEELMGENMVYWTEHGARYHLYDDCHHINSERTQELFEGSVAQAYELKSIKEMCKTCENRAEKSLVFVS